MRKTALLFVCIISFYSKSLAQWSLVNIPSTNYFGDIKFINSNTGFCLGADGLFKTTDTGNTWTHIASSPSGRRIFFVNSSLGFIITSNLLYKTVDGGNVWNMVYNFTSTGETLRDIYFTTNNIGYIITSFYNNPASSFIYKTTDGGTSWTKTNSFPGMATAEAITFSGKDTGFVVGYSGRVIKTYNAGSSWISTQLTGVETLFSVRFPSNNVGYAVGYSSFSGSEIIKTTNGGNSWQQLPSGGTFNTGLRSVYFHSIDTGYATGDNGRIIRTFDGGLNWQVCTSPVSDNFYSIYFTNSSIGFIAGDNGVVLKTINGGVNGIKENAQSILNVFPNPVINKITISNNKNGLKKYELMLKTISGQEVVSENIEFLDSYNLDLENLDNGIYFLTLKNDKEQSVQKIIVQK